jgi:CRISPR-associated endonuclease/helicase Cas3
VHEAIDVTMMRLETEGTMESGGEKQKNERSEAIAHVREQDQAKQLLSAHLEGVATLSQNTAGKVGLELSGRLIGLIHDLGKYSSEFQNYLQSAVGLLDPDCDEAFVDAAELKGKIDHSTAGAQAIWRSLSNKGQLEQIVAQILSLCVASHHSGLIDCITSDPARPAEDSFTRRINKSDVKTHLTEVVKSADPTILKMYQELIEKPGLIAELRTALSRIIQSSPERTDKSIVAQFQFGLLVRLLFSCLIDADRLDSANFEKPHAATLRQMGKYAKWDILVNRLENHLDSFTVRFPVDKLRREISAHCLAGAHRPKGIFTLTVPTGGGKTLASLRFALHHANLHKLERILFVIPFTSIIEQNADVVRDILDTNANGADLGAVVLEHHSSILPENQTWREKLLSENWDAPVVYTTSVQFLEALFGGGTRGARRMHQLANAIIVFDEVQTIPVKCVHLFNNAVNFLVDHCGSTVVLCTATQPLLNKVEPTKGAIRLGAQSELMPDVLALFDALKRVEVTDCRKPGGWSDSEIANLAVKEAMESGSCLTVVNTKKIAKSIFGCLGEICSLPKYHLSTSMCPMHRRDILGTVRTFLTRNEPVLCVSTQLIEAGVDIDFGTVIRSLAGLDSIAQAAGRCNRNGNRAKGVVHVVNPDSEVLKSLDDIRIGREKSERVLDDVRQRPSDYDHNVIGLKAMDWYYDNYFFARKSEMGYNLTPSQCGRDDTLLNLLSQNSLARQDYERVNKSAPSIYLQQSFMAAGKAFQAIDAPTRGIIVPYGRDGRTLILELCASRELEKQFALLRRAQQFTVNVFPNEFKKLVDVGAANEVQVGSGVYFLNERYYSNDFGLATEPVADEEVACV